jgi:hypothetical protein
VQEASRDDVADGSAPEENRIEPVQQVQPAQVQQVYGKKERQRAIVDVLEAGEDTTVTLSHKVSRMDLRESLRKAKDLKGSLRKAKDTLKGRVTSLFGGPKEGQAA